MAGARELAVLIGGRVAGTLTQVPQTRFAYDPTYAASAESTPLSISMPLGSERFRQATVLPWIDGLLPDSTEVRERWARQFGVSATNPFALLAHMGRDCPGSVQICPPDQVDAVLAREGCLLPVSDADIEGRLAQLQADRASWTVDGERWSLGGAQSKFALAWENGWQEALGSVPTTHIVKPGIDRFRLHALNEHYTMSVARELGLEAASTRYLTFGEQAAVVVTRYDRVRTPGGILRLHQEDLTQALSVARGKKYEEHGGPGAARIVDLLRASCGERDVWRFAEALAFNSLVGASDGHAKNYALLLAGRQVRLAPLYDISSALPYDPGRRDSALSTLAMAIGGERSYSRIAEQHWVRFAGRAGIDPERMLTRVSEMARDLPDALATVLAHSEVSDDQLGPRYLKRLTEHLRGLTFVGRPASSP